MNSPAQCPNQYLINYNWFYTKKTGKINEKNHNFDKQTAISLQKLEIACYLFANPFFKFSPEENEPKKI